jgi:hypothetical protein
MKVEKKSESFYILGNLSLKYFNLIYFSFEIWRIWVIFSMQILCLKSYFSNFRQKKITGMKWGFSFQFCDIAEVAIVHKVI